jgi:hypothetical protein
MIAIQDYEGGQQGFGIGNMNDVEQLNKALTAGADRPVSTGGGALRVESLEATLRIVTFTLQNIKFWKAIPKLPAFNTVEEYNILDQYGNDAGPFTTEGELPQGQDSSYNRRVAYVKFLGTTREVSHPMTLVKPAHGSVISLETQNGAVWLLERLERALFSGRSDLVPQSFDGIDKQILDGCGITNPLTMDPVNSFNTVIDLRGKYPGEDNIEEAANFISQNYGTPTKAYFAPKPMSELAKSFYPRERVTLPYPTDGRVGLAVTSMVTQAGLVQFEQDVFLRSGKNNGVKVAPAASTSGNAPLPPTVAVQTAPGAVAGSKFVAADAGAYFYRITSVNRFGESSAVNLAGAVTYAAADGATLRITDGGGANPATAYKVYRTKVGQAQALAQDMITIPASGGATTDFTDLNWYLPGCSRGYMLQENLQALSVRQLSQMMKIPLATIAASIRWMQLIYLTPIVYSPKRHVIFLNVGDA